jgi:hypothetical protein
MIQKTMILSVALLAVASVIAEDIKLKTGQIFKGAKVVNVTPTGIDISYSDKHGPIVRSLAFDLLPENLQKKYDYNPDKARKTKQEVKELSKKSWNHLLKNQVDKSCQKKAELTRNIQALNRKHDRRISAMRRRHKTQGYSKDEITNMIFAHRRSVTLNVTRRINKAAYGEIVARDENKARENILVIGADGDPDRAWRGVIYPAGVKTDIETFKALPVYCTSLKRAVSLLQHHLDRYSDMTVDRSFDNDREYENDRRKGEENEAAEIRRAKARARDAAIRKERAEDKAAAIRKGRADKKEQAEAEEAEENELQAETDQVEDGMEENNDGLNYWYGGNTYIYPNHWHHHRRHPNPPHHSGGISRVGGHRGRGRR